MFSRMQFFRAAVLSASIVAALATAPLPSGATESVPAGDAPEQVTLRSATARVGGLWCGVGLLRDFSLQIAQRAQQVEGKLVRKGRVREITGHVEGATLRTDPQRNETLELRAQGAELRVTDGTGPLALLVGQSFARAAGDTCTP